MSVKIRDSGAPRGSATNRQRDSGNFILRGTYKGPFRDRDFCNGNKYAHQDCYFLNYRREIFLQRFFFQEKNIFRKKKRILSLYCIKKHDGTGLRYLNSSEYTQMAGRAGRRGLDEKGNVIIYIGSGTFIFHKIFISPNLYLESLESARKKRNGIDRRP